MTIADITDDQIVAAVDRGDGCGGRVGNIAQRLGLSLNTRPTLHRRLVRLEAAGKVHRCPRYSAVNSIYWRAGAAV